LMKQEARLNPPHASYIANTYITIAS
jgi:hypothetical protein